jgi:hypothetical protein
MSFKRIVNVLILGTIVAILGTGCTFLRPPAPAEREYRPIPEAWLQPCPLPPAPLDNGALSEAFVAAMQCGQQGNIDKARIRELYESTE